MILFSVIVGVLAAYHFGLRFGLVSAGITMALLFAAIMSPRHAFKLYALVTVGVVGLAVVGPRMKCHDARPVKKGIRTAIKIGRKLVRQIRRSV